MLFVHPDAGYAGYVDWRSLGILWSLMVVIQGFRENTLFEKAGELLLDRVRVGWQLVAGYWYSLYPQHGAPQGSCAIDTVTPDGYRVDASGRWVP